MNPITVRIALQPRSYLLPALRREVKPDGFDVAFVPSDFNFVEVDDIDGGETSFSRYVLRVGMGDDRLVGMPAWVMRSFRHRCILVRSDSPQRTIAELAGARIGSTAWPDTGHTWTRALLRSSGIDLSALEWFIGGLTCEDVDSNRLGPGPVPENVAVLSDEECLVDLLLEGRLDAIFTPYMPPGFHAADSPIRHLLTDFVEDEAQYYLAKGYVPGVHLVTLKRQIAEKHPWMPRALTCFLGKSHDLWSQQRQLMADASPWEIREIDAELRRLGDGWNPFGLDGESANRTMTADFCEEMFLQGVSSSRVSAHQCFADYLRFSTES